MTKTGDITPTSPGFVVLHEVAEGHWHVIGEADRRPGLTARAARAQAIHHATGGKPKTGDSYAAILRSEWRIAQEL